MAELNAYQPIGMLESLVLTIGYRPCYTNDSAMACEAPDPTTVVVADFFLDRFLEGNAIESILGLEESVDFTDVDEDMFYDETLARQLEYRKGWCPYIINAIYVDMMGRVSVPDLDAVAPLPSAKRG